MTALPLGRPYSRLHTVKQPGIFWRRGHGLVILRGIRRSSWNQAPEEARPQAWDIPASRLPLLLSSPVACSALNLSTWDPPEPELDGQREQEDPRLVDKAGIGCLKTWKALINMTSHGRGWLDLSSRNGQFQWTLLLGREGLPD